MLVLLKNRWQRQAFLLLVLQALALSCPTGALLHHFIHLSFWWGLAVGGLYVATGLFFRRKWLLSNLEVARYLDKSVPALEESTTLLLTPPDPENRLASLQAQRVGARLENLSPLPRPYRQAFIRTGYWLGAAVLGACLIGYWPRAGLSGVGRAASPNLTGKYKQRLTPNFQVLLTIQPPAYTGRPLRRQQAWNLRAEQDAVLRWSIHSSMPLHRLHMRFSDTTILMLHAADRTGTRWEGEKVLHRPGFYQLAYDDSLSEFYKTEMIPDLPPVIRILSPGTYTVIDMGAPAEVSLHLQLSDDYGIGMADLHLTSASGSGEAVRFKETDRRLSPSFSRHDSAYDFKETLHLDAFGLHPGDDLYFYVRATDTRGQQSRSDRYIISLPDTAALMSLDGLASAADVKPEFLRSERQIIMDAEALIKEQPGLDLVVFHQRSNDLGVDQKLLRLRYGQFLGEESESDLGKDAASAGGGDQSAGAGDFGNAGKIIEAFTDKHDNAEDATFFDPATKEKLKATLSEMWKAEGFLRTYKPREALPFAFKALRLLKELQQQSRAYVAKTGVKIPSLKPEKRLTGDLGAIGTPVSGTHTPPPSGEDERKALGVLEQLKVGEETPAGALSQLDPAQAALIRSAAAEPTVYLNALEALGRIREALRRGSPVALPDVIVAQAALRRLLPVPAFRPGKTSSGGVPSLSESYFNHLHPRQP